ncbi:MAG: HlyD family secretion protein [Flavobacteriales bacterium]
MLNISSKSIDKYIDKQGLKSFKKIYSSKLAKKTGKLLLSLFFIFIVFLFLPWTQNIQSKGFVTTLHPDQRPQTIQGTIPGSIRKWYVKEGDLVKQGDTLLFISEIKDDYFDPKLLERTKAQVDAKEQSIGSYESKVHALNEQIKMLNQTMVLKLQQNVNKINQATLKIATDSVELAASITQYNIAEEQLKRYEELQKKGVISQTDLENRRLKLQEAYAKKNTYENKLLASKNDFINAQIEQNSIKAEYTDKLMKAESEKYSAMSSIFDTEASVAKLQSQFSSYSVRSGFYYITAPQDGFIGKIFKTGLGENIKEGEPIVSIIPYTRELAIELYINPIDMPLIKLDKKVQIIFDGWPSLVFSGWPGVSLGAYSGRVIGIDNSINEIGQYRILVSPDPKEESWPDALRIGSGARGICLLNDVPLWYEWWRRLNGFPPEYYSGVQYIKK